MQRLVDHGQYHFLLNIIMEMHVNITLKITSIRSKKEVDEAGSVTCLGPKKKKNTFGGTGAQIIPQHRSLRTFG